MSSVRRFLVASSIARLITRQRHDVRVVEGHFPPSHERRSHVLFEGATCHLVLVTKPDTEWEEEEERTEVSAKQGEFLMEVCAGSLAYHRSSIEVGGRPVRVESFRLPEGLHLIEVQFDEPDQANQFVPPIWFGPEVAGDAGYERNALATKGLPNQPEIALSDDAINALLDHLEQPEGQQGLIQQEVASGRVEPFPRRSQGEPYAVVLQRYEQLSAATWEAR
jgi:CYTH domain-containing protein